MRRAVHTLKGDSAACGFRELSELAHDLEDVLTPELAKQNAGLIAEVVLTAADTFHEMLAAYRDNLQPPAGGALTEHIRRLLNKPAAQAQKRRPRAKFEWTEYERLMIAEALRRGENVYNIALQLDPEALLPAAAFELARKGARRQPAGSWRCVRKAARHGRLPLHPGRAFDHEIRRMDSQALPGAVRGDRHFRRARARAANRAPRSARNPARIGSAPRSRQA